MENKHFYRAKITETEQSNYKIDYVLWINADVSFLILNVQMHGWRRRYTVIPFLTNIIRKDAGLEVVKLPLEEEIMSYVFKAPYILQERLVTEDYGYTDIIFSQVCLIKDETRSEFRDYTTSYNGCSETAGGLIYSLFRLSRKFYGPISNKTRVE